MHLILFSALAQLPGPPAQQFQSVAWRMIVLLPILVILIGTGLGFRALRDIRLSQGRLGGAGIATAAAGILPSFILIFGGGALVSTIMEILIPSTRSSSEVWGVIGVGGGLWLSFLIMRGMYRHASGWVPPVGSQSPAPARSALVSVAIIFTVIGCVLALRVFMVTSPGGFRSPWGQELLFFNFMALLTGFVCGVLCRHGREGKICSWISGLLLLMLVLNIT